MQGIRFYLEYPDEKSKRSATRKELGNHEGNVLAVLWVNGTNGADKYDAVGAVDFRRNAPVCLTGVSRDYLRDRCLYISEEKARTIHNKLFNYLDRG